MPNREERVHLIACNLLRVGQREFLKPSMGIAQMMTLGGILPKDAMLLVFTLHALVEAGLVERDRWETGMTFFRAKI